LILDENLREIDQKTWQILQLEIKILPKVIVLDRNVNFGKVMKIYLFRGNPEK
jgi:hypothetical protein